MTNMTDQRYIGIRADCGRAAVLRLHDGNGAQAGAHNVLALTVP